MNVLDLLQEISSGGDYDKASYSEGTVTTASGVVLAANDRRICAIFQNDSDTVIYLKKGRPAVVNTGHRLNANGGSYEMSRKLGNLYTGEIFAVHGGSGNKTLLIEEGS